MAQKKSKAVVKTSKKVDKSQRAKTARASAVKTTLQKVSAAAKKFAAAKALKSAASVAPKPVVKPASAKVNGPKVAAPAAKVSQPAGKVKAGNKPAAKPAVAAKAVAQPAAAKAASAKAAAVKPVVAPVVATKAAPAAVRAVPASVQKPAGQRISAPAPAAAAPAAVLSPKALAEKAAAARGAMAAAKKPVSARHGFKTNEFVVYPAHGVGRIVGIEEQEIAGNSLELFVIVFDKEKLTLRVPTGRLASMGMRKLAEDAVVKRAMETLKGRARVKRTMWSRRAQEYMAKINSGDLISIAEVVRDLYRSEAQPEQSYSERQLYEMALERMARELAAVERLDERGAVQRIVEILSKSAKGRRLAIENADAANGETKAA